MRTGRPKPWWVIAFNLLGGGLFLWTFVAGLASLRAPAPEMTEGDRVVTHVACPLDAAIAVALLGAVVLLLRRSRRASGFQRAAFWALLLRCGLVVMELSLPSEGGVGAVLILIGLPVLAVLTIVAFVGAVSVSRSDT